MTRKVLLILFALLTCFASASAGKKNKLVESYNMMRGIEALASEDYETAAECFKAEIMNNPNNGYAHCFLGSVYADSNMPGEAIAAFEKAIPLFKKDKLMAATSYYQLGQCYEALENTEKAIGYYEQAMALDKKDEDYVFAHINALRACDRNDEALADVQLLEKKFSDSPTAYVYVGRYYNDTKQYDKAQVAYSNAIQVAGDVSYSAAYDYRARNYMDLEKWEQAAEDICEAYWIDCSRMAIESMTLMTEKAYEPMMAALQRRVDSVADSTSEDAKFRRVMTYWCMANTSKEAHKAEEAIQYYDKTLAAADGIEADAILVDAYRNKAMMLGSIERYEEALDCCNQALAVDSTDVQTYLVRSFDYCGNNRLTDAIADADRIIEELPWLAIGYSTRARYRMYEGNFVKAIEDLDTASELDAVDAEILLHRGVCYHFIDRQADAESNFKAVVELEGDDDDVLIYKAYAYAYLGQRAEAFEAFGKTKPNEEEENNAYNLACINTALGDKDEAFRQLDRTAECGYKDYTHIFHDYDLIPLRDDPRFTQFAEKVRANAEKAKKQ